MLGGPRQMGVAFGPYRVLRHLCGLCASFWLSGCVDKAPPPLWPAPPPPAEALSITGKPIDFAAASTAAIDSMSLTPGTTGTPAAAIALRAPILSPITSIARTSGPMNTTPACLHASTKWARSLRKP